MGFLQMLSSPAAAVVAGFKLLQQCLTLSLVLRDKPGEGALEGWRKGEASRRRET